jgi:hypothetical protein
LMQVFWCWHCWIMSCKLQGNTKTDFTFIPLLVWYIVYLDITLPPVKTNTSSK